MQAQSFYPTFRRYYRTFTPLFAKPKVRAYTMLTLSLFTLTIFAVAAIRPTLVTITHLQKQIADERVLLERMNEKIANLQKAQAEYERLKPEFDLIFQALPQKPQASLVLGKLNRLLAENNIDVTIIQFSSISLTTPSPPPQQATTVEFTLSGTGSYEDILTFLDFLLSADRIITVDSVDIASGKGSSENIPEGKLKLAIRGKSYVLW